MTTPFLSPKALINQCYSFLLLDKDETVLGSFAYENKEVKEYISLLNSFQK